MTQIYMIVSVGARQSFIKETSNIYVNVYVEFVRCDTMVGMDNKIENKKITDLIPDSQNANAGTERGLRALAPPLASSDKLE